MNQLPLIPPRALRSIRELVKDKLAGFELRQEARERRRRRSGLSPRPASAAPGELCERPNLTMSMPDNLLLWTLQREIQEARSGHDPITVSMDAPTAWMLIATLQLALRHPEVQGAIQQSMRGLIGMLMAAFPGPAAQEMLRRGWGE